MSKKPTRSEIESALAGRSAAVNREQSRAKDHPDLQLDSNASRRQTVIGGNLTGISKRRRNISWLSRLRDTNYPNWLAIAIVILIAVAFFWPHTRPATTKEISKLQSAVQAAPYYAESRIDEQATQTKPEQAFTRDSDIERASDFRVQDDREKKIADLLSKAEAHVAKGEYSAPKDSNAVLAYKEILKLNAKDFKARQGLEYINGRFLQSGKQALKENKIELASGILTRMASINTKSSDYLELSESISSWKKKRQTNALLAKAKKSANNGDLILPARSNALYYYQQALLLDSNNQAAINGIQSISNGYIGKANKAVSAGQINAAKGYLATVSVIDPKNSSIEIIEKMISKLEQLRTNPALAQNSRSPITTSSNSNSGLNTAPTISRNETPIRNTGNTVSNNRTPQKEAIEQEAFDRQYLQAGLDAYYRGDYDSAASLLQPLADKGVSRAQLRIAYMHYLGRGFTKNKQEADRIIRAALPAIKKFAEQGRGWAQSDLGSLHEDGLVLPRNYNEAIYWYRSAAEKGYPGAQTNLGIMYAQGRGVTSSRRTAIEWFQRAAKQGDVAAKRNLESLGIKP